MSIAPETRAGLLPLEVEFGARVAAIGEDEPRLRLPLAWLDGAATECLFAATRPAGEQEGFQLFSADDLRVGWSLQPVGGDMAAAGRELYRRLLLAAAGRPLCRIWNYVPQINGLREGLENYRAFNAGRAAAFQAAFGADYPMALPSASAVGSGGDMLAAVFVTAEQPPRHLENPEQLPAYRYPSEHGPCPPSFARATVAAWGRKPLIFISGTAAIKGHATVAVGSFEAQATCTLDNLRLISRTAGLGSDLGASRGYERHFKIYLRHAADLPAAKARLAAGLLAPGDRVVWLQTDVCRAELDLEIEATLIGH
jgi:enamine deaminase RidA (YjgF/YER057c/UK114 family)